MGIKFDGILPAVASPCDAKEKFLEKEYEILVKALYKDGVHGVYICGATGDCMSMLVEERKSAAEIAIKISKENNALSIVHVGASCTRYAAILAEHAASQGASAVASMPPLNISQAQLVQYYKDISNAAGIPLFVYNIPGLTHRTFSPRDLVELLDIDRVVGFKHSDSNLFLMRQVMNERPDITVYHGNDEILALGLLYGAQGGIGMWYNSFPKLFLNLYDAVKKGDIKLAMKLQNDLLPIVYLGFKYGLRQVLELVMERKGLPSKLYRSPQKPFNEETRKLVIPEVEKIMKSFSLC